MTDTDVRRIEDKVDGLALVLARLEGSLSPTLEKLTEGQNDLEQRQKDYEVETDKRFESLEERTTANERFRYSVPSLSVLALLFDALIAIYYLTHPH